MNELLAREPSDQARVVDVLGGCLAERRVAHPDVGRGRDVSQEPDPGEEDGRGGVQDQGRRVT
jgi:hypothetical protein